MLQRLVLLFAFVTLAVCLTDLEQYEELVTCLGDEANKYNITLGGNFKITVTPKTDRQLNAVKYDQRLFNCTFIYMRGRLSSDTGPWGEETNEYRSRISEMIRNGEIPLGKYPEQHIRSTAEPDEGTSCNVGLIRNSNFRVILPGISLCSKEIILSVG